MLEQIKQVLDGSCAPSISPAFAYMLSHLLNALTGLTSNIENGAEGCVQFAAACLYALGA